MMESARPAPIGTHRHREATSSTSDRMLPLVGGTPQTVFVKVVEENATKKVYFYQDPNDLYSGIIWQTNGYALMITFVFVSTDFEIVELIPETPGFWFSDTYAEDGNRQQGGCAASLPGTYHFNVMLTDLILGIGGSPGGSLIDPKIVITPIVNGKSTGATRIAKR